MPEGFKSIKDAFNSEQGLKKIRSIVFENDVVNDFEKIFPDFAKIAQAKSIHAATLTLKVENAAWRNELKFKEKEIIEKINSYYGQERIIKIKFSAK
jgi:hypothetical protein